MNGNSGHDPKPPMAWDCGADCEYAQTTKINDARLGGIERREAAAIPEHHNTRELISEDRVTYASHWANATEHLLELKQEVQELKAMIAGLRLA